MADIGGINVNGTNMGPTNIERFDVESELPYFLWMLAIYPGIILGAYVVVVMCNGKLLLSSGCRRAKMLYTQSKTLYGQLKMFISVIRQVWKMSNGRDAAEAGSQAGQKEEGQKEVPKEAYIDGSVIVIPLTLNGVHGVVRLPYSRRALRVTRHYKVFLTNSEDREGSIVVRSREITQPPGIGYTCTAEELGGTSFEVRNENGDVVAWSAKRLCFMEHNL